MDPLDDRLTRAGQAWREGQPGSTVRWSGPSERRRPRWLVIAARVGGIAVISLVVIGGWALVRPTGLVQQAGPGADAIALLTQERSPEVCHAIGSEAAVLSRDERSGLGAGGRPVAWPPGYTARDDDGVAVLLDADGREVAREGDRVAVGGGSGRDGIIRPCGGVGLVATRLPILSAGEPMTGCRDARASGRLARDVRTGLGLAADDGTVRAIRWPYGFTAEVTDGVAVLRDQRGIIVAREGELLAVGGSGQTEFFAACGPVLLLDEEPLPLLTADRPGNGTCRMALASGTLARSDRSGLGLRGRDGPVSPMRWPFGFSATIVDGSAVLRDPRGGVAHEGDRLSFAGGGRDGVFLVCSSFTLADSPGPGPTDPPSTVSVLDTDALLAVRAQTQSDDPPRIVLFAGSIARLAEAMCTYAYGGWSGCEVGQVTGTDGDWSAVWAASDAQGAIVDPIDGLFAIQVSWQRLEFLGQVVPSPAGGTTHTVAEVVALQGPAIGSVVAVDGWLAQEARRCPVADPEPRSPFDGCGDHFLSEAKPDGYDAGSARIGILMPLAYPSTLDPMLRRIPTGGTFLLRRIANEPGATPTSGWLLLGRVSATY